MEWPQKTQKDTKKGCLTKAGRLGLPALFFCDFLCFLWPFFVRLTVERQQRLAELRGAVEAVARLPGQRPVDDRGQPGGQVGAAVAERHRLVLQDHQQPLLRVGRTGGSGEPPYGSYFLARRG